MTTRIHLIFNAHLDPVWLWDWREGMNEGIQTCRTILDLMDEIPELTFIRGESAIYRHIEHHAPDVFRRIQGRIRDGRWDVVGGTYIQPDTNLPATETLCRQFEVGKAYFQDKFGIDVKVAWSADSFGHSAGLPEIMAPFGIKYFAFTRPFPGTLPMPKPFFWWQGPSGARVLAYRPPSGSYTTERNETTHRLDAVLQDSIRHGLNNVACFLGLGNHGGGATRVMVRDVRAWAAIHPDVEVVFSGLHRFFSDLEREINERSIDVPIHAGELGFTLRGCYATAARFKYAYRRAEAQLIRAETVGSHVAAFVGAKMTSLSRAWDTLLFNSFHDILPGTSIERSMDEQLMQLGGVIHAARDVELEAINRLAGEITAPVIRRDHDDSPLATRFVVINPNPVAFHGPLEFECALDYRPILPHGRPVESVRAQLRDETASVIPCQGIATEHAFARSLQWRRRVVTCVEIPPLSYRTFTLGLEDTGVWPEPATNPTDTRIASGGWRIETGPDDDCIKIFKDDQPAFGGGIRMVTFDDPYGSWGDFNDAKPTDPGSTVRHHWRVTQALVLERGPVRQSLWVRMSAGKSRCDFTLSLTESRNAVDVSVRLFWDERCARVNLVFPGCGNTGEFDVPGAVVRRDGAVGDVPGGKWVRASGTAGTIGFASDSLYAFNLLDGNFSATLARATRYADDSVQSEHDEPFRPVNDCGELKCELLLTNDARNLPTLAEHLARPVIVQMTPCAGGTHPASGPLPMISSRRGNVL